MSAVDHIINHIAAHPEVLRCWVQRLARPISFWGPSQKELGWVEKGYRAGLEHAAMAIKNTELRDTYQRIGWLEQQREFETREKEKALKASETYLKERDTAARELAEAKAEIARLREDANEVANLIVGNMNEVPNTNERCALNLLHRMIQPKGGDAPCPTDDGPNSKASNAAHDTSEPSVERPTPITDEAVARIEKKHTHVGKNVSTSYKPAFIELGFEMADMEKSIHAPMAYETFVLMKQALEAQCKATAVVTDERDQLKAELAAVRVCFAEASHNAGPAFVAHEELDKLKVDNARYVDMSGRFANEVAQLKAENEKLRATVAAKDEAFVQILDVANTAMEPDRGGAVFASYLLKRIPPALSPEIANEFVRRAWLPKLTTATIQAHCDPGAFTPRGDNHTENLWSWQQRALPIALSRAEAELTKGNQP